MSIVPQGIVIESCFDLVKAKGIENMKKIVTRKCFSEIMMATE